MNSDLERQAKWYATKVVFWLFSVIASFTALAYINLMAVFILIGVGFVVMIAGALYSDAYYTKLLELNKGRWNEHKD
jgi:uncharacterized membrane protein